jgi:TPR repeat protein
MLIKTSFTALLTLWLMHPSARADVAMGLEAVEAGHWPTALAEFKPLANQGDPNAQVNMGNLYMRGLGVEQNYGSAYDWYAKAARQGHATGQNKLAVMLYYGLGVKENHAEAAHWFLKAAEQGDPAAAMVIAELYDKGDGVSASKINAYVWFSIAADLGKEDVLNQRAHLANQLSPNDLNNALTQLNVWRGQHDKLQTDYTNGQQDSPGKGKKARSGSPPQSTKSKPADR